MSVHAVAGADPSAVGGVESEDPDDGAASAISGYLEGVLHGDVLGWCCDLRRPALRLEVEVFVDGAVAARARADDAREGVARAGFGDGRYGFRVSLPRTLADGGSHRVAVRASGVPLPPTPTFIPGARRGDSEGIWLTTTFAPEADDADASVPPPPQPVVPQVADPPAADPGAEPGAVVAPGPGEAGPRGVRGYVDGVVGGVIVGWVVDSARPDMAVAVEAFLDGILVGESVAGEGRADVARQGFGANHGFRIDLPEPLEAGRHALEVRTATDGRRVPLAGDCVVLDEQERPVAGVELQDPHPGLLGGSPLPSHALLGLDGWLFDWPNRRMFHMLRGASPMPRAVLERQRARILARRDGVRAAGTTLVEAVVPAKLSVHREQLPGGLEVDDLGRPTQQVAAVIGDENGIDVLDLLAALRHARRHGPVFTPLGGGLTWLGGFHAYRRVAKEIAKSLAGIDPLRPGDLKLGEPEPVPDSLADLPRLFWIGVDTIPAGVPSSDEEQAGQPSLDWSTLPGEHVVVPSELRPVAGEAPVLLRRREPCGGPDALVIHDGVASTIAPFLVEHFERVLLVRGDADLEGLLAAFAPVVVLEIVAEPSLLR